MWYDLDLHFSNIEKQRQNMLNKFQLFKNQLSHAHVATKGIKYKSPVMFARMPACDMY